VIRVREVTKYDGRTPVLDRVSFDVGDAENLGLIGPGGAGKTLLLKIICGLVKADAGTVVVDGVDVQSLGETELAEFRFRIGMLFQNYALFDFMTVAENISFPLRQAGSRSEDEIALRVQNILDAVDLPHIGHQYPHELSGGMKKRVSFGRAVAPSPPLLFYDDPTAGLDPVTSSKIFLLLQQIQEEEGTTSITISHDIAGIKDICDRFVLIDRGRVVFDGDRAAIESSNVIIVRQFWDGFSDDQLG
jgi:phospholipid/cholesterol/gamma-HCH transport system ATP-binding protein